MIPPRLSNEQIVIINKAIRDENYSMSSCKPVRFLFKGQSLNIETGDLTPRNINVLYQTIYWNFSKDIVKKIPSFLGNDVTVIYSD